MTMTIRQEKPKDYNIVENVVEEAFRNEAMTDHSEHFLVAKIRESEAFIPELSLIAEFKAGIVGHVLLSKIHIDDGEERHESLALAPVSVLPAYQNKNIGSHLILKSIEIAKKLGYKSIIVLGHQANYPRFGFKPAGLWGIKAPFEVANEFFMALELEKGSLEEVSGTVLYSEAFA